MYRIAVIGDKSSTLSFKAVGIETKPVENQEEARQILRHMADCGQYAVIFLCEQFAEALAPELKHYGEQVSPAIILIPGDQGVLGIGRANISAAVEKAVGSNIL